MKLLAFSTSNSRKSINRDLALYAARRVADDIAPGTEILELDINDYEMPIFSVDREAADGVPPEAQGMIDRIGEADALIVCFAEHNSHVTAAWKNIFDWMSRIQREIWQNKPMVILAATPGGRAGTSVLDAIEVQAPFFGADLRGRLGIGLWDKGWDPEAGGLTRADDIAALDDVLRKLCAPT